MEITYLAVEQDYDTTILSAGPDLAKVVGIARNIAVEKLKSQSDVNILIYIFIEGKLIDDVRCVNLSDSENNKECKSKTINLVKKCLDRNIILLNLEKDLNIKYKDLVSKFRFYKTQLYKNEVKITVTLDGNNFNNATLKKEIKEFILSYEADRVDFKIDIRYEVLKETNYF